MSKRDRPSLKPLLAYCRYVNYYKGYLAAAYPFLLPLAGPTHMDCFDTDVHQINWCASSCLFLVILVDLA